MAAHAAPINLNLDGTIISPTDGPFVNGAAVQANLWFDLDATNALSTEVVTEPSGVTFKRFTFSGFGTNTVSPYNQTSFSGGVNFSNPDFVEVELINWTSNVL